MITKENEPIYKRGDDCYVIESPYGRYTVVPKSIDPAGKYDIEELKAYLADHPDAVQPEPTPPPPSDAQLEAAAEAQRQARFAEYDTAIAMLTRAERLGDATATAKIAAWDVYAVKLQEINDVPGWYKAPVWPDKPGV